jgi:tetratricopeptide (TPR) repeat protein
MAQVVDCKDELARAEENYKKGRFEEAITLLESCLDKAGLQQADRRKAYRLLGLNYLAQDYRDQARQAVTQLLRLIPDYVSDPNQDPPPFSLMVDEVRREMYPPLLSPLSAQTKGKSSKKKWILIGLGALAAGTAVALLLPGGEQNTPPATIAGPPALP